MRAKYNIGVDFVRSSNYNRFVITDRFDTGESCVLFRGNWYDWKDIVDALQTRGGDCAYIDIDNFTIKAYFVA